MRRVLLVLACLCGACTTTLIDGIPNLVQVRPDVWRGGQLTTREQYANLAAKGVRHIVKLNFPDECQNCDDSVFAAEFGIYVHVVSLPPRTDPDGPIDVVDDAVSRPPADVRVWVDQLVLQIVFANGSYGAWYVHCKNGWDRTGWFIGKLRRQSGWSKANALAEMFERGFHPVFTGLLADFLEWEPVPLPAASLP